MSNVLEEAEKLIKTAEDSIHGCFRRPMHWQEAKPLIEALGGKVDVIRCENSPTICMYIAALMVRNAGR